MTHEFAVTGPIHVRASVRSTDVVVTAGAPDVATVRLESSRDAAERNAFAAATIVELTDDVLRIEARLPRFFSRGRTCVHVTIPAGSSLQVETGSGDITVTAPLTRAAVRAGSGDIDLAVVDDIDLTTGSGDIRVMTLRTGWVTTGSGDVTVDTVTESLRTRTGSGDVGVGSATRLESTSGSGSVTVDRLEGEAVARSASGSVTVRRAVAGAMELRSTSGDVTVAVERGTAVLMDFSTVSGRMRSGLDAGGEPSPDEQRLELRVRTVSGDIDIRRA